MQSKEVKRLAAQLQDAGFLVRAVCYPTVPRDKERVRICVHAHNTSDEIARLSLAVRAVTHASL